MTALATLQAAGLDVVAVPDGRLRVTPAARLTDDLRALVRGHRAEILADLAAAPAETLKKAETSGPMPAPGAAAIRERFRRNAAALLAELEALPALTAEQAAEAAYYREVVSPRTRAVPATAPAPIVATEAVPHG